MSTTYDQETGDELVFTEDTGGALEAINRSEIDVQIKTAKAYPRSIKQFKADAMEMACLDEDTAASMFYVLPRGGKKIEGPSVRLAEVVGSSWGNLRYGSRIVGTDDKFITAQGMCFDLQKNIAASVEVKRRITDKNGNRFNDDMIQVTSNAACSIALRAAIFKVVPFAFVKPVYEQAKLTSLGKAESMSTKRHRAMDWFIKAGASQEQILGFLERKGLDDVTLDDLVMLRGLCTAIRDGEVTIEDALRVETRGPGSKIKTSAVNEKLKPNGAAAEPAPAEGVDPPAPDDVNQDADSSVDPQLQDLITQAANLQCPPDKCQEWAEKAMRDQDPEAFIQGQPWRPARGERSNKQQNAF